MSRLNKKKNSGVFGKIRKAVKKTYKMITKKFNKLFYVDFSKPLSFREQITIMSVLLFISCFLFTVVYVYEWANNRNKDIPISDNSNNQVSETVPQLETSDDTSHTDESNQQSEVSQNKTKSDILNDTKITEMDYEDIYNGDLILVNKEYECHYNGENTVSLLEVKSDSYVITDNSVRLNKSIVDNVNSMFDDFKMLYGKNDVMIACGYRDYDTQFGLYNDEVYSVGESEAEQWVAPAGFSEHQTGLVFDLTLNIDSGEGGIQYDGDGMYSWINKNCYKYGFIIRYLKGKEEITGYNHEPWHFRYVGEAAAWYIAENYITLEEYIDIVHTHTLDNPLIINGDNNKQWCVYYVKADNEVNEVTVPKKGKYSISGDNYSGFIVTAEL